MPHGGDMAAEALGRHAMFARIIAQSPAVKFCQARRVDENVHGQIPILGAGQFVDEIANGPQGVPTFLRRLKIEGRAQFV